MGVSEGFGQRVQDFCLLQGLGAGGLEETLKVLGIVLGDTFPNHNSHLHSTI